MKTYNEFQDEMIGEDLGEKVVARARKTPADVSYTHHRAHDTLR